MPQNATRNRWLLISAISIGAYSSIRFMKARFVRKFYAKLDYNNSGLIEYDDVEKYWREVCYAKGSKDNVNEEDIIRLTQIMFETMDENRDGVIDFQEFERGMYEGKFSEVIKEYQEFKKR